MYWSGFDINTQVLSVRIFLRSLTLVECWLPGAGYTTPVRDICMFAVNMFSLWSF